jgi:hypothetical protein
LKIDILGFLSFAADVAPLVLLLVYYKLLKKGLFLALFIWTCISCGIDVLMFMSNEFESQKLSYYAILIEPVFVTIMYFFILKSKIMKIVFVLISIVFALICVLNKINSNSDGFSYINASLAALVTLMLSVGLFIHLFYKKSNDALIENYNIFLIFGYIIYTSGSLFLVATTEKFPAFFVEPGLWGIFIVANILKNLFIVKFIVQGQKQLFVNN